jgi:uncharacterized membrane protein
MPSLEKLVLIASLGAITVIRTFLNYFLEKDLEASGDDEIVKVAS